LRHDDDRRPRQIAGRPAHHGPACPRTRAPRPAIDGYFHIRYSALLRDAGWRGFPPEYPWLPLTILAPDRYFDHHFLFHWWLALFTGIDLVMGAKIAAAIGAAAAFVTLYGVLVHFGVRHAHWWMLAGLSVAPGLQYRLEMPRVQSWSLVCLVIALPLFARARPLALFVLGWLFTWLYNAFPFLLAIGVCVMVARWWTTRELAWRPLAAAAAGVAGGLVVNPYFPHNLRFILHHYGAKLTQAAGQPVGSEWYPPLLAAWLGWGGLLALFMGAGTALYRLRAQLTTEKLAAALIALMFLACYWRANRFIEYFVPFTLIALALLGSAAVAAQWSQLQLEWRRRARAVLLLALVVTTAVAALQMRRRPNASAYAAAASWMRAHTPAGSLIFLADWDDFPLLYFHNTHNSYSLGLDPSYLSERDPALFDTWRAAADGRLPNPAATIRARFGAVAAFADHRQSAFIAAMDADPLARRGFADATGIVYVLQSGEGLPKAE
jgi:hypothetical protein